MPVQESSSYFTTVVFDRDEVTEDLGERVAAARRARRWSQRRLAQKAGVSRATVYRLEAGRRPPTPDTILRIARALGRPVEDFVPDWWMKPSLDDGHIGLATRERRRALGLTIAELAGIAGVSEATLSRHERGVNVSGRLLKLVDGRLIPNGDVIADALRQAGRPSAGTGGDVA